jgi:hypothetical protein
MGRWWTGMQGIGVWTARAADVAAITAGFVGELHIPNVGMFAIGIVSAMVAIGSPPAVTGGPFGTAVSGTGGPRPIVHDSMAALTTSGGIVWFSPAPAPGCIPGRPGSARHGVSHGNPCPIGPVRSPDRSGWWYRGGDSNSHGLSPSRF